MKKANFDQPQIARELAAALREQIAKTEANGFIGVINPETRTMEIVPHWDCESEEVLIEHAMYTGASYADEIGMAGTYIAWAYRKDS